jgi:glycerate kinase
MKVLVASDSFKGSLSSIQVGEAVTAGIKNIFPEAVVRVIPIADGGEGTVEALVTAGGGKYQTKTVSSPLGEPVSAVFGMLPDGTAIIEMAAASGLPLVPPARRNPLTATTRGTGELIKAALDEGASGILIGIGGSATNDGGAGMVQALGGKLLDRQGRELAPGGAALAELWKIDVSGMDDRLQEVPITVICDVDNPLCGPRGASAVYGPQKGANSEMVRQLDGCLRHYAEVIKDQLGIDIRDISGAGAAGGLGAGLLAFTKARLKSGTEAVLDTIKFDELVGEYDLVITGEGRIDAQSAFGKVPKGVGTRAQRQGKPVIAVVGSIGEGAEAMYQYGIRAIVPIVNRPMTLEQAVTGAYPLMVQTAERIFRLLQTGKTLNIG